MAESSADFGGGLNYAPQNTHSNFDRLSEGSGATEDGDAEVDYTMKVLSVIDTGTINPFVPDCHNFEPSKMHFPTES